MIHRSLSSATPDGNVITNNGMLTIMTSSSGNILGGFNSTGGGGIINNGTLTVLSGCNIVMNRGQEGGAVVNNAGASFTLSGGSLVMNESTQFGGGAVSNHGDMIMTDGTISHNEAAMNGGGIWSEGTLTINGCTITYNTCTDRGGGIYLSKGTLNLSGKLAILGSSCGENDNNLYVNTGAVATCSGPLEKNSVIFMTFAATPTSQSPKTVIRNVSGHTAQLYSDREDCMVIVKVGNKNDEPGVATIVNSRLICMIQALRLFRVSVNNVFIPMGDSGYPGPCLFPCLH